jgi:putative FmdB family regulatory protein
MPIYDYKCSKCDSTSEILVHSMESHAVNCPECGSGDMEKLITTSYSFRMGSQAPGTTCCGQTERCETPPCGGGTACCGSG